MVRLPKYFGQALRKRFGKKVGSRYEKQFEQNRQYHRWRHSREAVYFISDKHSALYLSPRTSRALKKLKEVGRHDLARELNRGEVTTNKALDEAFPDRKHSRLYCKIPHRIHKELAYESTTTGRPIYEIVTKALDEYFQRSSTRGRPYP
jgi:hypothetical protein